MNSVKDKIYKQIRHYIRLHDDVFLNQFDVQPFEQIKTKIYREMRNQVQVQIYREIKNNTYETTIQLRVPDLLHSIR
jgi:hypothetical protein